MAEPAKKIAVVQGAPSADIQVLFRSLAARWRSSARLAGVIAEDHGLPDRACAAGYLVSLADGERFRIFQDLGPGAKGCHLAPAGALAAAAAVQSDVAAGCDLVVLSKFGQLEKKGSGLRDAFTAAIEAGIPVLTSVSPAYMAAWESYAAPLSVTIAPDPEQIDAWWQSVRPAQEHDPKPQRPTTGE
jgi:Protein of unknown function (DUF2478)